MFSNISKYEFSNKVDLFLLEDVDFNAKWSALDDYIIINYSNRVLTKRTPFQKYVIVITDDYLKKLNDLLSNVL